MIGDLDRTWQRLELRHLAALDAVLRAGSFRGGARSLGYSQSAVSEQIATLEEIVGGRTIERSPGRRGVQPTAIGLILLRHSENITSSVNAAWADIRALSNARRTLRVGIFPSASVRLLPPIVRALHREQPDLELLLHEALDPGELFDLVADGELDIAFGNPTVAPPSLTTVELLEDPYVLLVAADHPLTGAPTVSPSEIAQLPLIDYRSIRPELLPTSRLPETGRPRNVVFRTDDDPTVHALVASGLGCALVSRLSVDPGDERVRSIPIDPPLPPRRLELAWLAGREPSPALADFVRVALQTATEGRLPRPGRG